MPLARFEHPDWIFEPKLDAFRVLARREGFAASPNSRDRHAHETQQTHHDHKYRYDKPSDDRPMMAVHGHNHNAVAKQASAHYTPEATTWVKIKNRQYSQAIGREDFFDRRKA